MVEITTAPNRTGATPQAPPQYHCLDTTQNGVRYYLAGLGRSATLAAFRSATKGASWVDAGNMGSAVEDYPGIRDVFIDKQDFIHVIYTPTEVSAQAYYLLGRPTNAERTAYAWESPISLGRTNCARMTLVAHLDPTNPANSIVHLFYAPGGVGGGTTYWKRYTCGPSGAPVQAGSEVAVTGGSQSGTTELTVDFRHTGDGKTISGQPDLFFGYGSSPGSLCFKKATWSAGNNWTLSNEVVVGSGLYWNSSYNWCVCQFDGTRVTFAGLLWNGSQEEYVIFERDVANTSTTTKQRMVNPPENMRLVGGYATTGPNGDIYFGGGIFLGSGGYQNVAWLRWIRATNTFSAATVVATAPSNATAAYGVSFRRACINDAVDMVYTTGGRPGAPQYVSIVLNVAPTIATGLAPASGTVDRTQPQILTYTFSDPNTGDLPSKTDWRWRTNTDGATGPWQTFTVVSTLPTWEAPALTFPAGGIEFQALPYDSQGVVAPGWSASAFFTAGTPQPAPTFVAPTSGSTIPTSSVTATISAPSLEQLQWRVVADGPGGAPNPSVVLHEGATILDPTARTFTATGLANGVTVHLQARYRLAGLWTPWADSRHPVSYTPPAVPTVVLTVISTLPDEYLAGTTDAISVAITNPAPTGSQPSVAYHDVYIDDALGTGEEKRAGMLPPGSTYVYRTPRATVDYVDLIRVVAIAANGTTSSSS